MTGLAILYADTEVLAVNKPPGLAVHEAPGPGSSVLRELRAQEPGELFPVHRLDKDTSGVLLLARGRDLAARLQKLWSGVEKSYLALCAGVPAAAQGVIDAPLLEHHTGKPQRLESALRYFKETHPDAVIPPLPPPKTTAVHPAGRSAQTEYEVLEKFTVGGQTWSWLRIRPRQGRMHQIRVHLAYAGHPLVLDPLYGAGGAMDRRRPAPAPVVSAGSEASGQCALALLTRPPLHAEKLVFPHPLRPDERITVLAPLPADLERMLVALRGG